MGASVAAKEDTPKCSEMKNTEPGDEGGLRTLECLRGRLLAERQASRVAKEQAELMESKLIQLESKVKEETKLRTKAEKKLKLLMRKLESLKISPGLEGLEMSSSSENSSSGVSCTSSFTSVSCPKDHGESDSKSQISSGLPVEENSSSSQDTCDSSSLHRSKDPDSLGESSHGSNSISQVSNNACEYEPSYPNSEATEPKIKQKGTINGSDSEDCMENSILALVPVIPAPEASSTRATDSLVPVDKSVGEVLDTLRLVRETLQSSIGRRRHMIRVGPA